LRKKSEIFDEQFSLPLFFPEKRQDRSEKH
jgi:hypothetical protein